MQKIRSQVVVVGLMLASVYLWSTQSVTETELVEVAEAVVETPVEIVSEHHSAVHSQRQHYVGLEQPDYERKVTDRIYGSIVSHSLLGAVDIGKSFAELSYQDIETVVLLAPRNFPIDESNFSISRYAFDTPFGNIQPNLEMIDSLIKSDVTSLNEGPFIYERVISSVTPFIAHYLPEAKIVPIVLRSGVSGKELDYLVDELLKLSDDKTVVVASVDFSHHLNRLGADFHDAASYSAVKSFDLERVLNLEIDSPPSLYVLLGYLEGKEAMQTEVLNTNTTQYAKDLDSDNVTSFFFSHFVKGEAEPVSAATTLHFGDMLFDREIRKMLDRGEDPFEFIKGVEGNFLRGVDAIVGNLEGPITDGNCKAGELSFRFDPGLGLLLSKYLDGVTLANNHSLDCYKEGLQDTKDELYEYDMFHLYKEDVHIVEEGGLEIAMVGVNEFYRISNSFTVEHELIKSLKEKHDQVLVHIHWGYEYKEEPSSIQRDIAHGLIDAGADVIIGHHPHVVQTVEKYKDSMIFYSLGNFIFDQPWENTSKGIAVGLVHKPESIGAYVFPYRLEDWKPGLISYSKAEEYCNELLEDVDAEKPDVCYIEW